MEGVSPKNLADPLLLETIDKLFELNIGEYVALPQLLVVGDQSSGKSSVLEGLTGLPYPRASTLCTRFATQITFRRAPTTKTAVSIIPALDAQCEYAEKLRKWKKDDIKSLDSETFANVLEEVYQLMELGGSENTSGGAKKTFANDVFKIEICGPNEQHLSVIDVPGIFRKTTPGVTTKLDMAMVRNMILSYMQNKRSVMLAVIPANVDIGTQEILEMAEQCDPEGQRTLGVLTKPDLVDKGAEQDVISIIDGKSHALNLGWCVVRNSGQQELKDSSADRHGREKAFFTMEEPWKKVAKDRAGIKALQIRLVEILGELIRREFPNVKSDINKRLKECKQSLVALGPSRETKDQQYKYLLELATRFQRVTTLALQAHYGSDSIFRSNPGLKLATAVVRRNESFSKDVLAKGHTMNFKQDAVDPDTEVTNDVERLGDVRYYENHQDLDDIMEEDTQISLPKAKGIKNWLEDVYTTSRGFELGTFDVAILPVIWQAQSANWDALAIGYINDIVSLVHTFIADLLSGICKYERIRRGLHSVLLDNLTVRYKKSMDHVHFILFVEREGTPLTTNHYFAENLEKSRNQRMEAQMKKSVQWNSQVGDYVKFEAVAQNAATTSNLEHTVCDLHDILKSYYKVARKRFVDNICMQAADYHLVTGLDTPIKVFTPAFVHELTQEQLEMIAGEDVTTRTKRKELRREIESLENGKKLL